MLRRRSSSWARIGHGVAPDPDDRADLAVGDEREVLAQDLGRGEGRPGGLARGDVDDPGRRALARSGQS